MVCYILDNLLKWLHHFILLLTYFVTLPFVHSSPKCLGTHAIVLPEIEYVMEIELVEGKEGLLFGGPSHRWDTALEELEF